MAVNLRKGAPTSTNIVHNVTRMSVLEYWTRCRLLGSSRTHRIHGSLARKSQASECRPLLCTLKRSCLTKFIEGSTDRYQDIPEKVKWSKETSDKTFQDAQDSPDFQSKLSQILDKECHTADDVVRLNSEITNILVHIGKMSGKESRTNHRSRSRSKMMPKKRWFDVSCILLKRELRRLSKKYGKDPTNSSLRLTYYTKKREYRSHIKMKKYLYSREINEEILQGGNISWTDFTKLRNATKPESQLDLFDMESFYVFFSKLYKKSNLSIDRCKASSASSANKNMLLLLQQILNKDISIEEVKDGVNGLKNGKAAGEDLVLNEFLKNSKDAALSALARLFNECLKFEVYPWNTTLRVAL